MLPRTHTWLHLLPSDAEFDCRGGPDWLRGPLATGQNGLADRKIVVVYDAYPPKNSTSSAFVGINSRGIDDGDLRNAGFASISRFAVIPGWSNPRWFIPLGSPAVASAGFNLYTPARQLARLKRAALRAVVYSRLTFLFRDQLLIAQRELSPLQTEMERLFPDRDLSIALSSGAPEGARNRKASGAVIDSDGTILAFLKLGTTPLARSLLANEAQVLGRLQAQNLNQLVPKLLMAGEIDSAYVTAQTPLPGRPAPTPIGPMHREFLSRLAFGLAASVAQTQLVRDLPGRIAALPEPHPELTEPLEHALSILEEGTVRSGAIHGDFAPWNLRRNGNTIAAFDWEYGNLDGPAGMDEIHYRLQVGYLLDHWTVERAASELIRPGVLDPYLSRPDSRGRNALVILYLIDILARLYMEGYARADEMVLWHANLLSRLHHLPRPEAVLT
jgi:hypothetical protein